MKLSEARAALENAACHTAETSQQLEDRASQELVELRQQLISLQLTMKQQIADMTAECERERNASRDEILQHINESLREEAFWRAEAQSAHEAEELGKSAAFAALAQMETDRTEIADLRSAVDALHAKSSNLEINWREEEDQMVNEENTLEASIRAVVGTCDQLAQRRSTLLAEHDDHTAKLNAQLGSAIADEKEFARATHDARTSIAACRSARASTSSLFPSVDRARASTEETLVISDLQRLVTEVAALRKHYDLSLGRCKAVDIDVVNLERTLELLCIDWRELLQAVRARADKQVHSVQSTTRNAELRQQRWKEELTEVRSQIAAFKHEEFCRHLRPTGGDSVSVEEGILKSEVAAIQQCTEKLGRKLVDAASKYQSEIALSQSQEETQASLLSKEIDVQRTKLMAEISLAESRYTDATERAREADDRADQISRRSILGADPVIELAKVREARDQAALREKYCRREAEQLETEIVRVHGLWRREEDRSSRLAADSRRVAAEDELRNEALTGELSQMKSAMQELQGRHSAAMDAHRKLQSNLRGGSSTQVTSATIASRQSFDHG